MQAVRWVTHTRTHTPLIHLVSLHFHWIFFTFFFILHINYSRQNGERDDCWRVALRVQLPKHNGLWRRPLQRPQHKEPHSAQHRPGTRPVDTELSLWSFLSLFSFSLIFALLSLFFFSLLISYTHSYTHTYTHTYTHIFRCWRVFSSSRSLMSGRCVRCGCTYTRCLDSYYLVKRYLDHFFFV